MRVQSVCLAMAFAAVVSCRGANESDSMAGTWSYVAPALSDPDYQGACRVAPMNLTLAQTADSVRGTGTASFFICTPTGGMPDTITVIPSGLAVRGAVNGSAFTFTIDGTYWTHTGSHAGGIAGGTMTLATTVGTLPVDLVGSWTATRQ